MQIHDARSAELARYKLGRVSHDSETGSHRVMCPALMGKIRCPLRPKSMSLDFNRPEVLEPPPHPPTCCVQQTITVIEEVTAKTAQRHDYPSKAHRLSYARRTAAERTFAWLQDFATVGMRRGWSRAHGSNQEPPHVRTRRRREKRAHRRIVRAQQGQKGTARSHATPNEVKSKTHTAQ